MTETAPPGFGMTGVNMSLSTILSLSSTLVQGDFAQITSKWIPVNNLDLSVSNPTLTQAGAATDSDGLLQVAPSTPITVTVPVGGSGFNSPEGRSTTITLNGNFQQTVQPQTVSLADIQSGAVKAVTFNVTFDPSLAGTTQTITATIDPGNVLKESNFANNTASVQVRIIPQLVISNAHIIQSVPDDFNLVQGKSTYIQFDVQAANASLTDSTSVTLSASLPDGSSAPVQQTAIGQIASSTSDQTGNGHTKTFSLYPLIPQSTGQSIALSIKATTPNQTFNLPTPLIVDIVKTTPFSVTYVPVQGQSGCLPNSTGGGCLLPLQYPSSETRSNSDQFIQKTFPIADNSETSTMTATVSGGQAPTQFCQNLITKKVLNTGNDILSCDLLYVWLSGLVSNQTSNNYVGIVPLNYFDYMGLSGTAGITPTIVDVNGIILPTFYKVSLVTEGFWEATAHEIAHTFGIDDVTTSPVPKVPELTSIPWNLKIQNISFDLMGYLTGDTITPLVYNTTTYEDFRTLKSRWISASEFDTLRGALEIFPPDPQVISIAAIIGQDGTASLFPLFLLPDGVVTPDDPNGQASVNLLDQKGSIIGHTRFNLANAFIGSKSGIRQISSSFFLITIPASSPAATVQISRDGTTLSSFDLNSQLLTDVIKAIPDQGFSKNPTQLRNALLNKVSAFTQILNSGSNPAAQNKLQNDIRKSVTDWVLPTYPVTSPLQTTQTQILNLIDFIEGRLQ